MSGTLSRFERLAYLPGGSKLLLVAGQGGEENTEGKLSPDFRTHQWELIFIDQNQLPQQ